MMINSFISLIKKHKIVIPQLQRDYAQGRTTDKVKRIRDRFLKSIIDTLVNENRPPLVLDFIYGYLSVENLKSEKTVTIYKPLDGQQRLTTLFLLHWYIATRDESLYYTIESELQKFSYATRAKSRKFCEELVNFRPDREISISEQIKNQPWFFSSYYSDPTIASMLVVLQEIEDKFNQCIAPDYTTIWTKLSGENSLISFNYLEIEELGLPDDLYIKMNSRGKELTDFESLKSQFSDIIHDDNIKIDFNNKIDKEWSDVFWNIFKNDKSKDLALDVDSGFLSFFWFITDIIIVKNNIIKKDKYWLDVVKEVYSNKIENVKYLMNCLVIFTDIAKKRPDYFESLFYKEPVDFCIEKTRLFDQEINLFHKCVRTYGYDNKANNFSIAEQLLLYACIIHLTGDIKNFHVKIRKLRNYIYSSSDQIRSEYLSSLYTDVENLMNDIGLSSNTRFSKLQIEEELLKEKLLKENPELLETLCRGEDNELLRGTLSIFDINNDIAPFISMFNTVFNGQCDYFLISKAMLSIDDYSQGYGDRKRFGNQSSATWRELFTPNSYRKSFNNTKIVLKRYLQIKITDNLSDEQIISINNIQKNWRYYYIVYSSFQKWNNWGTYGYYYWSDFTLKPYQCLMLFKGQFNGRYWNPYLLAISESNKSCRLENYGNNINYTFNQFIIEISMSNSGFLFKVQENDNYSKDILNLIIQKGLLDKEGRLNINQDENGIDTEDRIQKCLEYLTKIELIIKET